MCVCVCVYVCVHVYTKTFQFCLTLFYPMDCSPPGSSVHGILQARILEWVAISFSRGSPQPRDRTRICSVSYIGRQVLYSWCHLGSPVCVYHVHVCIHIYICDISWCIKYNKYSSIGKYAFYQHKIRSLSHEMPCALDSILFNTNIAAPGWVFWYFFVFVLFV